MKKRWRCYQYFWKLQWKLDRMSLLLLLAPRLLNAAYTLLAVALPGLILDSLVSLEVRQCTTYIIFYAAVEFANAFLSALLDRSRSIHNEISSAKLGQMLVEKTKELRMEQFEQTQTLERYELARKCAEKNSVSQYLGSVISFVVGIGELAGLLYLLQDMPFWVLLCFVAAALVHAVAQLKIGKSKMQEDELEIPAERKLGYLNYELVKPEYAKEIRLFEMKKFLTEKQAQVKEEYYALLRKYSKSQVNALQSANIAGSVLSVVFYVYNILRFAAGALTVGMFTVSMNAMLRFSGRVNNLVSIAAGLEMKAQMLNKVRDFLEMVSAHAGTGAVSDFTSDAVIEFENVSYRYPGSDTYALKDISVRIHPGEKISVVGPNGAGKTTFIALMLGMYRPTSGTIRYNGMDIETFDYEAYKQLFSVLLQDFQIFSFTIRDNILFTSEPSEKEIAAARECMKKAGLSEVLDRLPKREDTYLTQRFDPNGVKLSGGEEQKLAIARVLNRNSAVFILDEPTAALSPRNEYEIYERFARLTDGKTVLFISHRLSACSLCDRILVFQDGALTEDGDHKTLMQNNRLYAEMFQKQTESYT